MADFPEAQNLNPLLAGALRDPAKMQKDQVLAWMAEKQKEQAMQARGGGGFIQGLAPIIAAMTATKAPALGLLELLSQFENSRGEKTRRRDIREEEVPDLGMAFPVFGVGKTGRLAAAHRRLQGNQTKELPMFSDTGLMAPARQRELEKRMREWIPQTSTKEPEHLTDLLNKFVAERPGWGKVPMEKGGMTDKMHSKLRQSYYQALKEMGYGGIKYPEVRNYNPREATGTTRPVEILEGPVRPWEEILQFEQKGNVPAGWEKAFQALQEIEAARTPKPRTKTVGGR